MARFHADLLGAMADSSSFTPEPQGRVGSARSGAARPRLGFILSTYEWPEALDVVLRSLAEQSDPDFDLVVADDGSGPGTQAVVERWRPAFGDRLDYVWQADEGFRLARVLISACLHPMPTTLSCSTASRFRADTASERCARQRDLAGSPPGGG